jgi:hypothetical protein
VSKIAVVSFEGNTVKIVHALRRGKKIVIERADTIDDIEFDGYLQNEKSSEFIVTREFTEAAHDVISTPVLKPNLLKKYVEAEIRKATNTADFTFIYSVLGEKLTDNKKMLEVHYYMVRNEKLRDVLERFRVHGKTVRALYPSVFAAASLIAQGSSDELEMGVYGTGNKRIAFTAKKGKVQFIRAYDSLEEEFTDLDIQNIDMTIRYIDQNFQVTPAAAMILGVMTDINTSETLPEVPIASFYKAETIKCSGDEFNKFFLPLAALFAPRSANILSAEYKNLFLIGQFITHASKVFILAAVLCICFTVYLASDVLDKKDQIQLAASGQHGVEAAYVDYEERKEILNKIRTVMEFLNRPSSGLQKFLMDLSAIPADKLKLNSIDANSKDGSSFQVTLSGSAEADTYYEFRSSIEKLTGAVKKMKDVRIEQKKANMEDNSVRLNLTYK